MQDLATSTYVSEPAASFSPSTHPEFSPSVHPDLPAPAAAHAPGRRWWPWIVVLGLVGIGAYVLFSRSTLGQAKAPAPVAEGGGGGGARGVPVVVATARSGDMGVYLSGLGTVTPLNTVTVHTRVDGELVDVMFKEGQMVQQGDLLARIDSRPFEVQLTQANGQKAKDDAALTNGRLDLVRYQDLIKRGVIPKQQVDTQVATVNQAEGAVQSDQGAIESAKLNLVYSRIIAPISGRVGLRLIDPGNIVHAADAGGLVVITQLDPIAVIFTIAEDALPQVMRQVRNGAQLPVEAYDRDAKIKLATGTLLTTDNQIDQTTGTVKLKTIFRNSSYQLFPNQFVNARLLVRTLRKVTLVPSAAVQHNGTAAFVYVVQPNNTVSVQSITPMTSNEQVTAVQGLNPGVNLATSGFDRLENGVAVTLPGQPPNQNTASPSKTSKNGSGGSAK
jgi:multidrug efflux system membrane fusion protein